MAFEFKSKNMNICLTLYISIFYTRCHIYSEERKPEANMIPNSSSVKECHLNVFQSYYVKQRIPRDRNP